MRTRTVTTADGSRLVPVIGPARLRKRIRELALRLNRDYRGRRPVVIGVLNGSFMFCAELARYMDTECEFDFIRISSYGNGGSSTGRVKLLKDIQTPVRGRDVLLVEDIVDSGVSLKFLRMHIRRHKPRTFKVISLLYKKKTSRVGGEPDYTGFTVPDHFLVGFGLDYGQKFRNMSGIYRLVKPGDRHQERE